jgi:5-aminopentanamidase
MAESGTVVAVAQLSLTVGELEANLEGARAAVAEAALAGARLVVLPELSDSGYVFSGASEARSLASPAASGVTLREWQSLAAKHDLTIAGGFCELGQDGKLYNSAAIVDASGTRAVYRKVHLWDAEKKIFTPGDEAPPVVELPFGNVGLLICYDLEFPEWVRLLALAGADLIAVPVNWAASGSPAPPGERSGEVVAAARSEARGGGREWSAGLRCWAGGLNSVLTVINRRTGVPEMSTLGTL